MTTTNSALLISLADIALLAQVQRPAVTMWKARHKASALPFPSPKEHVSNQEFFDAYEVGQWLNDSGRGNNPHALQDVASFAAVTGIAAQGEDLINALTSLLALRVLAQTQFTNLDAADLLDLADEHDPDNDLLYTELELVEADLVPLARYTDLLVDSAYNPAAAFEQLMERRFRSGLSRHAGVALTEPASELVASVAVELAAALPSPAYADPTRGGSDLLIAVARRLGDGAEASLLTGSHDDSDARLVRRRLCVHGLDRQQLDVGADGEFGLARPAVLVAQYPSPGDSAMDAVQILSAIENIQLQMNEEQRAVIIAPAAVLTQPLRGEEENIRGALLRSGRLRAVVRLPQGLLVSKSRQALALWVLGSAHPSVEETRRWTMAADLGNRQLTPDAIQDLVSDISAAMGTLEQIRAHSFRFAHLALTRVLLAERGSLVAAARTSPPLAVPDGAEAALRADELLELLSSDPKPDSLYRYSVEPSAATLAPLRQKTTAVTVPVEKLLAAKQLTYRQGHRIDPEHLGRDRGVRVVGPEELSGNLPLGSRTIDLLVLSQAYPAARVTEAGDVVFCTGPRPAAVVDTEGSAVVLYPARILRINPQHPGGLHPHVLAADINAVPSGRGSWKRWPVRRMGHGQEMLTEVLAELAQQRDAARIRLQQLEELTTLVLDGVAGGTLTVTNTYAAMEGNS
ncbi:hypothetical protein [Arthrobacter sp. ZGTC212]|uniref:hypothetical protein n=1 Tax=Arthrobacter sp. ZGTC212 TaxID=2058899 RepID=UPI000CE40A5A|nr:hypothetical protein [Arthrobacter sp. ZGTC212]